MMYDQSDQENICGVVEGFFINFFLFKFLINLVSFRLLWSSMDN